MPPAPGGVSMGRNLDKVELELGRGAVWERVGRCTCCPYHGGGLDFVDDGLGVAFAGDVVQAVDQHVELSGVVFVL